MQGGILQSQAMKTLNRSLGMFSAFAGAVLLSCAAAAADDAVGVNAYASFDASSAYVLYCARQNKDPCTQLSGRLEYAICRNVALHASLSFSVIADDEIRGAIDEVSSDYAKQFVWGNIGVSVSF
jgi:hypothetical protein